MSSSEISFKKLLSQSASFLQDNLRTVLVIGLPAIILAGILESITPAPDQVNGSILFTLVVTAVVGYIIHIAHWILAADRKGEPVALYQKTVPHILPMLGISIMSFLKSWMWLMFVGVGMLAASLAMGSQAQPVIVALGVLFMVVGGLLGIVFMPRFIAAQILHLRQGKGVMESVNESYRKTKGYWGTVFINSLVFGFGIAVLSWVANMVINGVASGIVAAVLIAAVQTVLTAFGTFFAAELATAVLAAPSRS